MKNLKPVNWEEQWTLFAQNYHDGKAHIDLTPFGKAATLLLLPGPGFGDLSHPTTHLMLDMMQAHVKNTFVLDIGTGSGILALAALMLGARSSFGIDIDSEALIHARNNNKLNNLSVRFAKAAPKEFPPSNILLMNMILSEQRIVNPPRYNPKASLWIVSGILARQEEIYLAQAKRWGWAVRSRHQRGEWLGWVFELAQNRHIP